MRVAMRAIGVMVGIAAGISGCSGGDGAHLVGEIVYLGAKPAAVEVPATASAEIAECTGGSIIKQAANLIGIDQSDERLSPPFYIGLWPKPAPGEPEVHGRFDHISIGTPQPGDYPFLKQIVCSQADFDWKVGELLGGEYYIGAWIDYDFNGFPGKDEPFGFYRGDNGSEDFDPTSTDAVAVAFGGEPLKVRILIGNEEGSIVDQLKIIRQSLERALTEGTESLFLSQFQPLHYKDAWNRTYNELGELWDELITDTHPAGNSLTWAVEPSAGNAGRSQTLLISQSKDNGVWDLAAHLRRRVEVVVGEHRSDGQYGIIDWRTLVEESGDIEQKGSVKSEFGNETTSIEVPLKYAAGVTDVWVGLESFVPSAGAPTGGDWVAVTASGNPSVCRIPAVISIAKAGGTGCRILLNTFDADKMMRLTVIPVGSVDAGHYPGWAGYPNAFTEPVRGNYARYYFFGSDYRYRR